MRRAISYLLLAAGLIAMPGCAAKRLIERGEAAMLAEKPIRAREYYRQALTKDADLAIHGLGSGGVHVGGIAHDEMKGARPAGIFRCKEEVAAMECHAIRDAVELRVLTRHLQGFRRPIESADPQLLLQFQQGDGDAA